MTFGLLCQHELSLNKLDDETTVESMRKKIMKVFTAFEFCLGELGVWLALKVLFINAVGFDFLSLALVKLT